MDRDHVDGLARVWLGRLRMPAGSVLGDSKLKAEGGMAELEGRVRNAIGGAKGALREANRWQ